MALDGITTSCITHELKKTLLGGRIDKIHQPNNDEISFQVRGLPTGDTKKVLVSSNSNNPRMHITKTSRENPMKAPLFCMVLRKHIAGGKIVDIYQPNFERIIIIEVNATNEMGDMTRKKLILEIMGKHSNIILTDENNKVLDSIKRVSHEKSSVREILPNKEYVYPPNQNKKNPLNLEEEKFEYFQEKLHSQQGKKIQEFIYQTYTGISPTMATEICLRASLNPSLYCAELTAEHDKNIYSIFVNLIKNIKSGGFSTYIYSELKSQQHILQVVDFSVFSMELYKDLESVQYSTVSEVLEEFYEKRDTIYHIKQRSADMRKVVQINIDRCIKKKDILFKTRKDTKNMHTWKKKGELITANIYSIQKGMTTFKTIDFYEETMPEIEISLDPNKTPSENAQKYFSNYNKAKRTLVALEIQEKQNHEDILYLESVLNALDTAKDLSDLTEIRTELGESGFLKKQIIKKGMKKPQKSKPMHYLSSDGYDIYVGKSNIQNDELTLKFAKPTDLWLHTKEIAGSHVIILTNGTGEAPDTTLTEAGNLAVYYSKASQGSAVPVDYTIRKNVKKPTGAKAGMVIYLTNKTMYITPDLQLINNLTLVN